MISSKRMILDLLEFILKELDQYGDIIFDNEYILNQDTIQHKMVLYNDMYYDVKRVNGNIERISLWGDFK